MGRVRSVRSKSLKFLQEQEPKMLFDLKLGSCETSWWTGKRKFALGLKTEAYY